MESMTRLELFANLGYPRDPFLGASYKTADTIRTERILAMAIESHAMVAIIGERGIGKTKAVDAALKARKIKKITVEKIDKETLTIGDIRTALITDLAPEEGIKRGGEISSRQLRRIVGTKAVVEKQKIVLVIEEAQRIHPNTLRSLKSLREQEWMGESELYTIILISQSDPMNKPGVSEVSLRSDRVWMKGLSAEESAGYVTAVLGKHFEPDAVSALAVLPKAKNYLELQELTVALLNIAMADGRETVTVDDVQTYTAQKAELLPQTATPRKQAQTGSGKSALSSVLNRKTGDETGEKGAINA